MHNSEVSVGKDLDSAGAPRGSTNGATNRRNVRGREEVGAREHSLRPDEGPAAVAAGRGNADEVGGGEVHFAYRIDLRCRYAVF